MKKAFTILLVFMLLIPTAVVFAQPGSSNSNAPGIWVSSMNIQNVGTTPANVSLDFYDSAGIIINTFTVTPVIPAGGMRSLYMPTDIPGLSAGEYSVVASSDTPVQVVVNLSSSTPYTAGAYNGFDSAQTASILYFPGLYNNYYGFNSEFSLQNAGSSPANISIQFYKNSDGSAVGSPYTTTIAVGASQVFGLAGLTPALPSGTTGIFSAKITSTNGQALAGIANAWSSYKAGEFATYDAVAAGSNVAFIPGLYNNYYHFVSSLNIQNIGTAVANVTATYSNGTTSTAALQPNSAVSFYIPLIAGLPSGVNGTFSAKVTTDNPASLIVATVNNEDKNAGSLSAYNSYSAGTNSAGCPVVMQAYYKWFSAATVQNVGTATTNITATYSSGQTLVFNNVPANGAINVIELPTAGSVLPNGSVVSVTFSSSGQPIVAVVNENSNLLFAINPGDYLLSYSCSAN